MQGLVVPWIEAPAAHAGTGLIPQVWDDPDKGRKPMARLLMSRALRPSSGGKTPDERPHPTEETAPLVTQLKACSAMDPEAAEIPANNDPAVKNIRCHGDCRCFAQLSLTQPLAHCGRHHDIAD